MFLKFNFIYLYDFGMFDHIVLKYIVKNSPKFKKRSALLIDIVSIKISIVVIIFVFFIFINSLNLCFSMFIYLLVFFKRKRETYTPPFSKKREMFCWLLRLLFNKIIYFVAIFDFCFCSNGNHENSFFTSYASFCGYL